MKDAICFYNKDHLGTREIPIHDDAVRELIIYEDYGNKSNRFRERFAIISIPFDGRIEIPLCGKEKLVAEIGSDPGYKEIYIGIEEDGVWWQDLAVIGEKYHYDDDLIIIPDHGEYSVKVYGKEWNEDYTEEFIIPKYKEEKDYE